MTHLRLHLSVLVIALAAGCAPTEAMPESPDAGSTSAPPETPATPTGNPPPDSENCPELKAEPLRLMSFNVKRGQITGNTAIATVINAEKPSLVGLQEIGNGTADNNGENQAYYIAQKTGLGPALRNAKQVDTGYQANALMSGFPILSNEKFVLTATDETRIVVVLTVEIEPGLVATVGVAHFGLNAEERKIQAQEVIEILRDRPNPVLIGDFNARPDSAEIETLTSFFRDAWQMAGDGPGYTFPADQPDRRIDYIFLGPGWPDPVAAYVPDAQASDHRPLVVVVDPPSY